MKDMKILSEIKTGPGTLRYAAGPLVKTTETVKDWIAYNRITFEVAHDPKITKFETSTISIEPGEGSGTRVRWTLDYRMTGGYLGHFADKFLLGSVHAGRISEGLSNLKRYTETGRRPSRSRCNIVSKPTRRRPPCKEPHRAMVVHTEHPQGQHSFLLQEGVWEAEGRGYVAAEGLDTRITGRTTVRHPAPDRITNEGWMRVHVAPIAFEVWQRYEFRPSDRPHIWNFVSQNDRVGELTGEVVFWGRTPSFTTRRPRAPAAAPSG
jgi:hypothetical protein